MLYPRITINRKDNKFLERLEYLKECILVFFKAFRNYNSFILFFEQKFHF